MDMIEWIDDAFSLDMDLKYNLTAINIAESTDRLSDQFERRIYAQKKTNLTQNK